MPTIRLRSSSISIGLPRIRIKRNRNPYIDLELQTQQPIHHLAELLSARTQDYSHPTGRPYGTVIPKFNKRETAIRLKQLQEEKMAGQGRDVEVEERRSFGIGGAGNIRRPSDPIYPVRTTDNGNGRRTSVWSSISSGAEGGRRRSSLVGLFTRKEDNVDKTVDEDVDGKGSEA